MKPKALRQRTQHLQGVVRRERQRREAARRFREPHTGKQAGHIAAKEAGLEFNPVIRQMRGEAKGSRKREADIGSWYNQLGADFDAAAAQAQQAYGASEAATTQRITEAAQRGTENLKDLSASDAKLAALVGAPRDSSGLSQMAAGQAASDRQRVTLAQPGTMAGANYVAYVGGRKASAQMRGIEARKEEGTRRQKIKADMATARREKGASTVANLEKIREGDRAFVIQQKAFNKEKPYEKALRAQARMGLKGTRASARATIKAAGRYGRAKERTAEATERAAEEARRGKNRSAGAQEKVSKNYGENSSKGGYNVREAQALLSSAGKAFKTPQAAINYLVNRGVKIGVARQAVNKATGKR